MGKSVKKSPVIKENSRGSNKKNKKIASHAVRSKTKAGIEIGNGNEYKKHFESWNISDYKFKLTEEEALADYQSSADPNNIKYDPFLLKHYPTEKEFMRWWRKHYKNK